jgi:hypothetical protein
MTTKEFEESFRVGELGVNRGKRQVQESNEAPKSEIVEIREANPRETLGRGRVVAVVDLRSPSISELAESLILLRREKTDDKK